jgi:hypothetical protein
MYGVFQMETTPNRKADSYNCSGVFMGPDTGRDIEAAGLEFATQDSETCSRWDQTTSINDSCVNDSVPALY